MHDQQNLTHTPAPWHVEASGTSGRPLILWSASGHYIARVDAFPQRGHPENEANARLIAAAPEMLEQLEMANRMLECIAKAHPGIRGVINGNLAAIAKATGGAL